MPSHGGWICLPITPAPNLLPHTSPSSSAHRSESSIAVTTIGHSQSSWLTFWCVNFIWEVCNDVKICQCLLVRVCFVFGRRWGGMPLRDRLEVSSGVATSMLRAFLKFCFRGCFTACWLISALTGARCQPCNATSQCLHVTDAEQNIPLRSKWGAQLCRSSLEMTESVCTELLNCVCFGLGVSAQAGPHWKHISLDFDFSYMHADCGMPELACVGVHHTYCPWSSSSWSFSQC